MIKKSTRNEKKTNANASLWRGWSQVPPCFRENVKEELKSVFGVKTHAAFLTHIKGKVEARKSQIDEIERIFNKVGITDIWGSNSPEFTTKD